MCSNVGEDAGAPDTADVVVWEAGEAHWASTAAMHQSGAVIVAQRTSDGWREIRHIRSPQPVAYGGFGSQLSSNGKWLAVLASRSQRVWIFDLQNVDSTPIEIEDVRGFARTVATLGDQVVIGGTGEARVYLKEPIWTRVAQAAAPEGAPEAFSGQIVAQDDLIVATSSGARNGDAGVLPGRVDVFRQSEGGWKWESRLAPTGVAGPFGQDCCVSLDHNRITINLGDQRWRFVREDGAWHDDSEGAP